jgi:hypothetical protein
VQNEVGNGISKVHEGDNEFAETICGVESLIVNLIIAFVGGRI